MIVGRVVRRIGARLVGARSSWPKLVFGLVLLAALPVLALWRGFGADSSQVGTNASEMVVERLDQSSNRINLVLKEKSGPRRLVLAVGPAEAYSIVNDTNLGLRVDQNVTAYALSNQIAGALGGRIQRVVVNEASDKAFFTKVILSTDSKEVAIDASTGDAIALALRSKAPIYAENAVLEKAGIVSGR